MTNRSTAPAWHTHHAQVLDFAHVMTDAGALTTAGDVLDYLADPSAFTRDHDLWTRSGRPRPPCIDDLAEARMLGHASPRATALRCRHRAAGAAWDLFCGLLDEVDRTGRSLHLVADIRRPAR